MKKVSAWIIVLAIIVLAVLWGIRTYNKMVSAEEEISKAWGNVENVYQRRADLVPNLVSTVKGAADFEKSTLEAVISARAEATSTKIDPTNITEENMATFQKAQNNLSSALNKLLVVVERYPELKANQNFLELQAQLEGTENRIAVERNKFNESVKPFNAMTRKFPANIIANIGGFEKKAYFEASEGSETAPKVELNF
ncbi:MAG: LemA family protein [Bacteroidales bacterium]|jgi:LemA protein